MNRSEPEWNGMFSESSTEFSAESAGPWRLANQSPITEPITSLSPVADRRDAHRFEAPNLSVDCVRLSISWRPEGADCGRSFWFPVTETRFAGLEAAIRFPQIYIRPRSKPQIVLSESEMTEILRLFHDFFSHIDIFWVKFHRITGSGTTEPINELVRLPKKNLVITR